MTLSLFEESGMAAPVRVSVGTYNGFGDSGCYFARLDFEDENHEASLSIRYVSPGVH